MPDFGLDLYRIFCRISCQFVVVLEVEYEL